MICALDPSNVGLGYARPVMEPNFVGFPTAISLQDPPLPRFREAPLLHLLLRPEVASMTVLTEAQVVSVSMVAVLDHSTSWQTKVSLAKKCLPGHVQEGTAVSGYIQVCTLNRLRYHVICFYWCGYLSMEGFWLWPAFVWCHSF